MPTDDTDDLAAETGRRLRLTRAALGYPDQRQFGEDAGLEQSLYNRFDTGNRLLTLNAALRLCAKYKLTLDWLYRDDLSGLPLALASRIRELRRKGDGG